MTQIYRTISLTILILMGFGTAKALGDLHVEINDYDGQLNIFVDVTSPLNADFTNFATPRNVYDPLTYTDSGIDTADYDLYTWDDFGDWFTVDTVFLVDGFFAVEATIDDIGVFLDDEVFFARDDFGVTVPAGTDISSGLSFVLTAPLPTAGFTNIFIPGSYASGSNTIEIRSVPEPSLSIFLALTATILSFRRTNNWAFRSELITGSATALD